MKSDYLVISERVQEAIDNKIPVIAIESSGIFLGMTGQGEYMDGIGSEGIRQNEGERPNYYKIAEDIEKLIIQNGAVPALIAVLDGKIHVGLHKDERQFLDDHHDELVRVCQSDLPIALAMHSNGVTTVSATMMIAQMAGIPVVVSLGIGGVSMDFDTDHKISADIEEMVHSRVVVVATGINPGYDPDRTLEYLETRGVPVLGFRSDKFYSIWIPDYVEHSVRHRVNDPTDIASALAVKRSLDIDGSILVINPSADPLDDAVAYDTEKNANLMMEILHDNVTLAAWIAMAICMDMNPNIDNKNSKRANIPKKEKSISFEVWLFAVKKFAQNYDVALLIFNNLPDSEKERLRQEYEDTVE